MFVWHFFNLVLLVSYSAISNLQGSCFGSQVIAEYLQKIDPKSDGAKRDWVAIYDECANVLYQVFFLLVQNPKNIISSVPKTLDSIKLLFNIYIFYVLNSNIPTIGRILNKP